MALDGLLNTESRPGEKRLTLAIDGETYKRLRLHVAETDQTHPAILEAALAEHLRRAICTSVSQKRSDMVTAHFSNRKARRNAEFNAS